MGIKLTSKRYNWGLFAIILYFVAFAVTIIGSAILSGIADIIFLALSCKAIYDIDTDKSALTRLGVLGLVVALSLWGFAEMFAGIELGVHASTIGFGLGQMYLGIIVIIIAIFAYTELKVRREQQLKENTIQRAAYLKRKGELQAETEYK